MMTESIHSTSTAAAERASHHGGQIGEGRGIPVRVLWLATIGLLIFLSLFLAPRRGAPWISDDGFFLIRSWMVAHGFGLDKTLIPQDPCYLFNALLMKLGLSRLLVFRQVSFVLTFISASTFFLALDPHRFRSPVVPLAVCTCLLVSITSVSTPASLSLAFFMLGAAGLFFHMDNDRPKGPWLPSVAGLALAIAGFMHAAVALAMVGVAGFALWAQPSLRRSPFGICFAGTLILLWGWYLHTVGIGVMFASPAAHDNSSSYLLGRVIRLLYHLGEALIVFALVSALLWRLGPRRYAFAQTALSLLVTVFYGWTLICYVSAWPEPTPWLRPPLARFFLTAQGQSIPRIPGAAAYLFFFASFRWLAEAWACEAEQPPLTGPVGRLARVLRSNASRRKLIVATGGLLLINWALSAGSLSALIQNFALTGGGLVGLVLVMDSAAMTITHLAWPARLAPYLWLGLLMVFALGFNHPTNASMFVADRQAMEMGPLKGIFVSSQYRETTNQMEKAYHAAHAEALPLVALDYVPLVNLVLDHPLPSHGIVRPAYHFPEARIRSDLDPVRGWCVLDITGIETRAAIRDRGFDIREPLRQWIAANSDSKVQLSAPSEDLEDLTLYFKQPAVKM